MYLTVFGALTMTGNTLVSREPLLLGLLCLLIAAPSLCHEQGKNMYWSSLFLFFFFLLGVDRMDEKKKERWKDGVRYREDICNWFIWYWGLFPKVLTCFLVGFHLNIVSKSVRLLGAFLQWELGYKNCFMYVCMYDECLPVCIYVYYLYRTNWMSQR